ncbi:MAG: tRNA 2-selenouridine(34) synthase MnmH [Gammaproteobacteria bacterium]|nr:tRNA 2-selenouridine(34) synthase MnmH [Gammaproteobacteria bacterium]
MPNPADTDKYLDLFLNNTPLMDVRAPVEFNQGAFPHSSNMPLLDDEQRAIIGKQYKDAGQDEAIELGLRLATPEIRAQRLQHWKHFVEKHPQGYLYCFRGGLRSRTTQAWLREQGIDYPLIKGGYKAMRSFLLQQLELSVQQIPFLILSGLTGSGKTRVLLKTRHHIDLEGLANHRGSAFGRDVDDFQPVPINWENSLSIASLQYRHRFPGAGVLLEDEGKMIGRLIIPQIFYKKMLVSPRVFLERSMQERVRIISEDYISANWPLYQQQHTDQAEQVFTSFVLDNLARIKNRLGGDRYQQVYAIFKQALTHLFESGSSDQFDEGIRLLLLEYYDPMYQYQLQKKPVEVIFRGNEQEVLEWVGEKLQQGDTQS